MDSVRKLRRITPSFGYYPLFIYAKKGNCCYDISKRIVVITNNLKSKTIYVYDFPSFLSWENMNLEGRSPSIGLLTSYTTNMRDWDKSQTPNEFIQDWIEKMTQLIKQVLIERGFKPTANPSNLNCWKKAEVFIYALT